MNYDDYLKQQAAASGVTVEQYKQLMQAQEDSLMNQGRYGGQKVVSMDNSGGSGNGLLSGDTLKTLQVLKALGATSGDNSKNAAPVDAAGAAAAARKANPLGALGTAALGAVGLGDYGGSDLYTNPNPATGTWDKASGTSNVPQATVTPMGGGTTSGTGGDWNQVAQAAGLSQNDVTEFQKQGLSANDVAQKFGVSSGSSGSGITTTVPSIFTKAPMPQATPAPTQIYPSQQATAAQYNPGQAFAIAPQQPVTPPPAAPQGMPATMAQPQASAPDNSGALKSWSQLGSSAGAGYGHDSQNAGGDLNAGISGLSNAASMWQRNQNYAAGGAGTQSLGQLPASGGGGDMSGLGSGAYSGEGGATVGGGASAASKQAGLALISQAGKAGDALKDYGANASWKTQPSSIPSPDDFKYQGPAVTFRR